MDYLTRVQKMLRNRGSKGFPKRGTNRSRGFQELLYKWSKDFEVYGAKEESGE